MELVFKNAFVLGISLSVAVMCTALDYSPAKAQQRIAYVSNTLSRSISVIDLATSTVIDSIPIQATPRKLAVTSDGSLAYVAHRAPDGVLLIDLSTRREIGRVRDPESSFQGPESVALSPDGALAYVTNFDGAMVSVIDTAANTVFATIPVGPQPSGVAFSLPDGERAYVANFGGNTVSLIDTKNRDVSPLVAFSGPASIAVEPSGRFYVTNSTSDSVDVRDADGQVLNPNPIPVDSGPVALVVAANGLIYVANFDANTVSAIDDQQEITAVDVGLGPAAVAAEGPLVYVATLNFFSGADPVNGLVTAIDINTNERVENIAIEVGQVPVAIAIAPAAPSPTPRFSRTPTATRTLTTTSTITPTSVPSGPGIAISDVNAAAGETVAVTATLKTGGGQVAGTQNDVTFATAENRKVTVVRKPNGRPDCTVNPEISKGSTAFAFQPPSCTAETCTAVRAIVFSSEDVEPIADNATLYTCKVQVAADATGGTYPLTISGTILSNPTGGRVCGPAAGNPPCSADESGSVVLGPVTVTPETETPGTETPGTETPGTETPTPTGTPPPSPTTPVPTGPGIKISSVQATPGQQATIDATLATGGGSVAGTQNDFTFATAENRNVTVVRKTNGRPDCTVNPEISKGSTTFAFQPPSCTAETCTAVRAIVFSSEDVEPIADGATLYTCKVQVAEGAPEAVYPLTISGTILSNPTGGRVCGPAAGNPPCSGDQSGAVVIGSAPRTQTPAPTLERTLTPTPTRTSGSVVCFGYIVGGRCPTGTPTGPAPPASHSATETPTAKPAPPLPARDGGGGGCSLGDVTDRAAVWFLTAVPVILMLRRSAGRSCPVPHGSGEYPGD